MYRWQFEKTAYDRHKDPQQLSGASGTDGKFLAVIMKGSVVPTMAAENDRKPFI